MPWGVMGASNYHPVDSIEWHTLWWASDPEWAHPGDGAAVTALRDASGNGRDASVVYSYPGGTAVYEENSIGGQPGIVFAGPEWLCGVVLGTAPFTALVQPYTMVVIAARTGGGAGPPSGSGSTLIGSVADNISQINATYIGTAIGYAGSTALALPLDTDPHLWAFAADGASSALYCDEDSDIEDAGGGGISQLCIGGGGSGGVRIFWGSIVLAGLVDYKISPDQYDALWAWAQSYYGLGGDPG